MISIRVAEQADLPALLQIYNEEVLHGTATFDLHPKTLAERQVWFDQHNQDNHPLLTAELDGTIAGYASLSAYAEKEGNPLYPVPVLMDAKQLEQFYYLLMEKHEDTATNQEV